MVAQHEASAITPVQVAPVKNGQGRDHRIDAMRGAALLMMFVDHIPQSLLNRFTMRNVGFADAAEVFVLLAGYASWLAYGRGFKKYGVAGCLKRIFRRCVQLYIAQAIMVFVSVASIRVWRHFTPVPVDFLEPELAHGIGWIWRAMTLDALPSNLNILPLYIVFLAGFPLYFLLMRLQRYLALLVAGALWFLINLDPDVNFPNWLDPDGWYFNPLAWQFLFALGVTASAETERRGTDFPRIPVLSFCCIAYLIFSAFQAFPWAQWSLPDLRPLGDLVSPAKSWLSPLRLFDVLAIFYLMQSSSVARVWASDTRVGQILARVGRYSLDVFVVGTILDLYARLVFTSFGDGWILQIVVNVVVLGVLFALAGWLDARRKRQQSQALAAAG
ncbi:MULTISPECIES: OpgC family protein [Acetobacter]|uniref:OpgC family protein n=1 Tax=Acetobacter TaxID=434 RepID=UPI000A39BFB9|nr:MULTISPECIES: OpgC domain-containing protein [Acetobacter]MBS0960785.1 OpgC domain-containing protein [Acetobacter thailandicus]